MIVGVLSDTHGDVFAAEQAYRKLEEAEAWIFLGDGQREADWLEMESKKPAYRVKGNCDAGDIPAEMALTLAGAKLLIAHGHTFAVSYDRLRLALRAQELGCCAALYGHTHVPEIEYMAGVQLICPGSPSAPRNGRAKSFARLDIRDGNVLASIIAL